MYSDTVTIFNFHRDSNMWFPTVISNVDLVVDHGANKEKTGLDSADTAKLHIRYHNVDGKAMIGDKEYLMEKQWQSTDAVKRTNTITFSEGHDFFIRGDYDSSSPISDDDNSDGFYNRMRNTYDDCFLITTVGGPYKLIPHFEIGGK